MRVSADVDDPGYREDFVYWHVLVDGQIAADRFIVTADEEAGTYDYVGPGLAKRTRTDLRGRLRLEHTNPAIRDAVDRVTEELAKIVRNFRQGKST